MLKLELSCGGTVARMGISRGLLSGLCTRELGQLGGYVDNLGGFGQLFRQFSLGFYAVLQPIKKGVSLVVFPAFHTTYNKQQQTKYIFVNNIWRPV